MIATSIAKNKFLLCAKMFENALFGAYAFKDNVTTQILFGFSICRNRFENFSRTKAIGKIS